MLIVNFCGIATTFASKANHLDVIFFLINQIIFTSICHQNNRYSIHSVAGLIIAIGGCSYFLLVSIKFHFDGASRLHGQQTICIVSYFTGC